MKQTSPKHSKELRAAAPIRAAYLQAHTRCEVTYADGPCTKRSVAVHEPLTRARGGAIDDPENMLAVCAGCHALIHVEPRWAMRRGYLKSAYGGAE